MVYDDIKALYHSKSSIVGMPSDYFSNFHDCSKDTANNVFVVENYCKCIKFERINEIIYSCRHRSCDSLFLSDKTKGLLFIEFKNRQYDESDTGSESVIGSIIEQAGDSIFLHCDLCKDIDNFQTVECDFAAVVYKGKNKHLPAMDATSIMLFVSGRTFGGSGAADLNNKLEILIRNYISNHYSSAICSFSFIGVVLSTQFSVFLGRYI